MDEIPRRVSALEGAVQSIREDVKAIKINIWIATLTIVATTIFAVLGTGVAIQQMTVSTFQSAAGTAPTLPHQQPIIINVPASTSAPVVPSKPAN